MKRNLMTLAVVILVLLAFLFIWMSRFSMYSSSSQGIAFRLNRFTGKVHYCRPWYKEGWIEVKRRGREID